MTLVARVAAVKTLLQSSRDTPGFTSTSSIQADHLKQYIEAESVEPGQIVALTLKLQEMSWATEQHRASVIAAVANSKRQSGYYKPQDFTMFMRYLTATVWDQQTDSEGMDDYGLTQLLFAHLGSIGLTTPSEPTYAAIMGFRIHVDSKL